ISIGNLVKEESDCVQIPSWGFLSDVLTIIGFRNPLGRPEDWFIAYNVFVYGLLRNFSRSPLRSDEPLAAKIPLERKASG
ncbi:hypothetical protein AB9K26_00600, partial [Psychroserpens sp. XS_ASV72]|uniref:hypothetical protein n=1 Tax=Psychroserpens sp. XS_ASV72 TaxID=3241293 RepID=UPI0035128CDC